MSRPSIIPGRGALNISLAGDVREAMKEVSRRERRTVSGIVDDLFRDYVRANHPDLAVQVAVRPPVVMS